MHWISPWLTTGRWLGCVTITRYGMQVTSPLLSVCGRAEALNPTLRTPSNASPNDVYRGIVVLPGGQERAPAYVKVFPPATRHQSVYNEVIAHHLALQCQLPTPTTFPCAC